MRATLCGQLMVHRASIFHVDPFLRITPARTKMNSHFCTVTRAKPANVRIIVLISESKNWARSDFMRFLIQVHQHSMSWENCRKLSGLKKENNKITKYFEKLRVTIKVYGLASKNAGIVKQQSRGALQEGSNLLATGAGAARATLAVFGGRTRTRIRHLNLKKSWVEGRLVGPTRFIYPNTLTSAILPVRKSQLPEGGRKQCGGGSLLLNMVNNSHD